MSLIPFSKEQFPKLDSAQLEAIQQRISVRTVAASNVLMAAERSFPHVTLDDALVEALHEQPEAHPKTSPEAEVAAASDSVRPQVERQAIVAAATPAILETTQSREALAREKIAAIFGQSAVETKGVDAPEEAA